MDKNIPQDFKKQLSEYIKFQSISTDPVYKPEIEKTVNWIKTFLEKSGASVSIFQKGNTNPVVFGHFQVNDTLPTMLIYGHYDVQPAGNPENWKSQNPFELEEITLNNEPRLVARGVVDNKAQNLIHMHTVAKLFGSKELKYNVKFLLEGNEESGNEDLPEILADNAELLKCDMVIVSDGEIVGKNPVIEATLRGGANVKIILRTGKNNLHSGIFGGAVPNAAMELSHLLSKLKDEKNKILIPNFYNNIIDITPDILENNRNLGNDESALQLSGTKVLKTINNYDFYTQTGLLPTLEISGINTGYIGNGFANIVPAQAEARINLRSVANQKTQDLIDALIAFVKENIPEYVELEYYIENHGDAIKLDDESNLGKKVVPMLEEVYGRKVLKKYIGGSIPILSDFQKILNTQVLSISLGNDDCNMHGDNENFSIDLLQKALDFSEKLFSTQI